MTRTSTPSQPTPLGHRPVRGRLILKLLCALLAMITTGCHVDHEQSMLHPRSEVAAEIAVLWWVLLAICGIVFVIVMLLLAVAIFRRPTAPAPVSPLGSRFVIICGGVIPAIILVVILVASVRGQMAMNMPETELTIEVIGYQWWWEVRYPEQGIITANELHIPVGRPVRLEITSADVVHSLWIPNLNGKTDMLPDKVNTTWLQADREGVYRGQCAEYCGVQHALMALRVVALPEEEYQAWVADQQRPAIPLVTELQRQGKEVFFAVGCNNCHAVWDSPAKGRRGPDLTHLASRRTLGAGVLPNNRGNLAGWISDPQVHKPGNLMPRTLMTPEQLHALLDYLETLE